MTQRPSDINLEHFADIVEGLNILNDSTSMMSDLICQLRFNDNSEQEVSLRRSYVKMLEDQKELQASIIDLFKAVCQANFCEF